MTAKEYLLQARTIKLRLETMAEQLTFLKSIALYNPPQISDMPKTATPNIHKNEDAIIRVIEKEEQIKAAQSRLTEVIKTIDVVPNSDQHAVLVKRYLGNKTWDVIASEIFVSEKTVRNIHSAALRVVEEALKNSP